MKVNLDTQASGPTLGWISSAGVAWGDGMILSASPDGRFLAIGTPLEPEVEPGEIWSHGHLLYGYGDAEAPDTLGLIDGHRLLWSEFGQLPIVLETSVHLAIMGDHIAIGRSDRPVVGFSGLPVRPLMAVAWSDSVRPMTTDYLDAWIEWAGQQDQWLGVRRPTDVRLARPLPYMSALLAEGDSVVWVKAGPLPPGVQMAESSDTATWLRISMGGSTTRFELPSRFEIVYARSADDVLLFDHAHGTLWLGIGSTQRTTQR
jgi:hypothetical protein